MVVYGFLLTGRQGLGLVCCGPGVHNRHGRVKVVGVGMVSAAMAMRATGEGRREREWGARGFK